uniref:(northern house mosquito) hypothetical protein n=1 Tax=Culex pipiens TaxID=7175 RepID=A0A8D8MDE9_CULPI
MGRRVRPTGNPPPDRGPSQHRQQSEPSRVPYGDGGSARWNRRLPAGPAVRTAGGAWHQARSRGLYLLLGAGRQSVQLWRLEHDDRLLRGNSSGPLSNLAAAGHLPEGPAGATDLNIFRTDLLLRHQRDREAVYRGARLRAGLHLVSAGVRDGSSFK